VTVGACDVVVGADELVPPDAPDDVVAPPDELVPPDGLVLDDFVADAVVLADFVAAPVATARVSCRADEACMASAPNPSTSAVAVVAATRRVRPIRARPRSRASIVPC
jgi:hypothetical protein